MQKHQKLFTGFNFLDQKWGGIYQGGNYLVFGPRKSGKTVLILNIIEYLTESTNNVLFLTSERKKNIEIQSSSIYFDISEKIADGNLRVLKLTRDLNILESIKTEIENIRPSFLVVDEVINANFSAIGKSYTDLLEHLENQNITSFFVSSLPMDENSRKFLKDIVRNSTGIIHLQKSVENRNYSGILKLKPNIGHFEGEFETSYKIEPIKGMITLSDNENTIMEILSGTDKSSILEEKKDFEYTNLYSYDEFKFLIESKSALSRKTGENLKIISFNLLLEDINTMEICSKFLNKLQKGDKISYSENRIFILPASNDFQYIQRISDLLENELKKLIGDNAIPDENYMKKIEELNTNFNL